MARRVHWLVLVLAGCDNDVGISENARCDGVLQASETTVDDAFDMDLDGFPDGSVPDCQETYAAADLDCDDGNEAVHPGAEEVCGDTVDNDCDGNDESACSYSGTWGVAPIVSYSCAYGLVAVGFNTLSVFDNGTSVSFGASGGQPGTMTGQLDGADFTVSNILAGSCAETYTLSGSFTSATEFSATFTASFSGTCLDCTNQTIPVTGTLF